MDGLAEQARQLDAQARHHKKRARHHQQALRATRQKQAEIEKRCREAGIAVTYQGEGELHGRTAGSAGRRS